MNSTFAALKRAAFPPLSPGFLRRTIYRGSAHAAGSWILDTETESGRQRSGTIGYTRNGPVFCAYRQQTPGRVNTRQILVSFRHHTNFIQRSGGSPGRLGIALLAQSPSCGLDHARKQRRPVDARQKELSRSQNRQGLSTMTHLFVNSLGRDPAFQNCRN